MPVEKSEPAAKKDAPLRMMTCILKSGRRIIVVQSVDGGDVVTVRSASGKYYSLKKLEIHSIDGVKP